MQVVTMPTLLKRFEKNATSYEMELMLEDLVKEKRLDFSMTNGIATYDARSRDPGIYEDWVEAVSGSDKEHR